MLKKRAITALWALPLTIIAVWFDKPLPWFTVLVAICGLLAAFEFYRLAASSKVTPLTYFGLVWTLLFIIRPPPFLFLSTDLFLTSGILIPLIWLLFRAHKEQAFADWAWTMAGILYIGWLLSYLVALRYIDNGRNWVFFALFTTFAYDTIAFFTGRTWGKHKLAPRISPSKTWEGVVGGVTGAIIISLLFILPTPLSLGLNWRQAILLGILVSVFSQLGDLVESLLKRNMGAKDSGRLMPGHGGILDRIDSLIFAGVIVYYYAIWIAG
ncbi:MAG: phosphatidate cytidylyltransferase [Chloroflexi bacterium]|nr:phosphatidate cytidylyltransferase [Chloroflexota bacterium]